MLQPEAARRFIRDLELRLATERLPPSGGNEALDMRRLIDRQVRSLITCYRVSNATAYEPCILR